MQLLSRLPGIRSVVTAPHVKHVSLTEELARISSLGSPSDADQKALQVGLTGIHESAKRCIDGPSRVLPFGSAVTGFWTPESDVDVCIQVSNSQGGKSGTLGALKLLASELRKRPGTLTLQPIYTGKVPIIKWRYIDRDNSSQKQVAIDVSVNNLLAVRNSELLRTYAQCNEPLMRPLVLGIKLLARSRGMNNRAAGTLSSFSLVLMLISYLQQRRPTLLPDLQLMAERLKLPAMRIEGKETRFFGDDLSARRQEDHASAIKEELTRINRGVNVGIVETGQLFKEFVRFYAFEYRGGVIKVNQNFEFAKPDAKFFVENPFEQGKDVANVTSAGADKVQDEFKRAYRLLSSGKTLAEVCRD